MRPTLVGLRADLPAAAVAQRLVLWQRGTANAVAYADALARSIEQGETARKAGDSPRAQRHLQRSVYLATTGQKELRRAVAARTEAIRMLYRESRAFREQTVKSGRSVEEALAAWQGGVRANGLPPEYAAALQKAGLSEAEVAKRREWLQTADAKAAAKTQEWFLSWVAPFYLPEARGKANAHPPLPAVDDVWDSVAILLLHSRVPAGK